MKEFKITSNLIDSQTIGENSGIGARSVFEGTVRDTNDGHDVTKLEYECYESLAIKEGNKIDTLSMKSNAECPFGKKSIIKMVKLSG